MDLLFTFCQYLPQIQGWIFSHPLCTVPLWDFSFVDRQWLLTVPLKQDGQRRSQSYNSSRLFLKYHWIVCCPLFIKVSAGGIYSGSFQTPRNCGYEGLMWSTVLPQKLLTIARSAVVLDWSKVQVVSCKHGQYFSLKQLHCCAASSGTFIKDCRKPCGYLSLYTQQKVYSLPWPGRCLH